MVQTRHGCFKNISHMSNQWAIVDTHIITCWVTLIKNAWKNFCTIAKELFISLKVAVSSSILHNINMNETCRTWTFINAWKKGCPTAFGANAIGVRSMPGSDFSDHHCIIIFFWFKREQCINQLNYSKNIRYNSELDPPEFEYLSYAILFNTLFKNS